MILRPIVFVAALALLAACANSPAKLPQQSAPDRLIIITVANEDAGAAQRAGSTPRAYDGMTSYAVSAKARASVKAIAGEYHLQQVAAWPIEPLKVHCVVFRIEAGASRDALLAQLAKDRRLLLAQPMNDFKTLSVPGYNDPYISLQRGFARIDVADAQRWSRGDNVRVAIIDTGIDTAHPDLEGRVVASRNFVDADTAQFARDRHGTAIAGVVAALANNHQGIVGIAPGVHLIALKACWQLKPDADAARCNSFTLAQALVAALDLHAQVINLSLAGPLDPLLGALVEQGSERGVIFVGAAPESDAKDRSFPANAPHVIAVGSAEAAQRDSNVSATHIRPPDPGITTRPSTAQDILHAPGQEILTLAPGGRYDFFSGTSLATAHVTGAVALLLAENPKLSAAQVGAVLLRTSSMTPDSPGSERSINACVALASMDGRVSCLPGTELAGSADATSSLPAARNPSSR